MSTKFSVAWKATTGLSWLGALAFAALSGCAATNDDGAEQALEADAPPAAEEHASAAADEDVPLPPAIRADGVPGDLSNLAFGSDSTIRTMNWIGSSSGTHYQWIPGARSVIYGVQVRSGDFVDAIRFASYRPSQSDNLYRGEPCYWTQWFGPTGAGTLRSAFYCPGNEGLTAYTYGLRSDRIATANFWCNWVDQPNGTYAAADKSPVWGSNTWVTVNGIEPCQADELITSFNLSVDGSSLRGIQSSCQDKR
jgi:hypothetical protein